MSRYLAERLATLIPTLLAVSILAFLLTQIAGGDPARESAQQGGEPASPELVAELRELWGLNDPLPVRYLRWLGSAMRGDLGESFLSKRSVTAELLSSLPATIVLALGGLATASLVGIPLGVLTALRRGSRVDSMSRIAAFSLSAVPAFWLGLLLITLFAESLRLLPAGGYGIDQHLILPAIALGTLPAATVMRLVRASVLDIVQEDYVRTASAKGLAGIQVAARHIVPNALIPAISYLGLQFGHLLAGAVVIESIFSWPGVGRVVLAAVSGRDMPIIAGYVLVSGLIYVIVNLTVDVLYVMVDPRIRLR
jgi:peptide/nickel transport system permease protein